MISAGADFWLKAASAMRACATAGALLLLAGSLAGCDSEDSDEGAVDIPSPPACYREPCDAKTREELLKGCGSLESMILLGHGWCGTAASSPENRPPNIVQTKSFCECKEACEVDPECSAMEWGHGASSWDEAGRCIHWAYPRAGKPCERGDGPCVPIWTANGRGQELENCFLKPTDANPGN